MTHNEGGKFRLDEQLKSRCDKVLEHYAGVIKERDDVLIRETEITLKQRSALWSIGSSFLQPRS